MPTATTRALVAPDHFVERQETIKLATASRLATIGAIAKRLPSS